MAVQSGADAVLAISATLPATNDQTGFEALSFTDIGEAMEYGEVGPEYQEIEYNTFTNRITQVLKGNYNPGTLPMTLVADDSEDAGQIILKAASASDNAYAFALTLQDTTVIYFQARVMSFKKNVPDPNSIVSISSSVRLIEDYVQVDPSGS